MTEMEELKKLCWQYSLKGMCKYLWVTKDTVSRWSHTGWKIPRRWKRLIIEYFEWCNSDVVDFLQKIGEELKK